MYLKRLEIHGFKSFAARTAFDFGPGVTAVVGPNGSGKSNLADALRWVLGEQNPRALRSRKSEEVIFAGDRKRPPAGFAEVSIALDNSDGWLPLDFQEVSISRRLHRSGESEYLVNRARVRLKDVSDLFARARVGQNSYAIMGQGLVDQVLNLKPEERRSLIEEAADVRGHRLKIVDAVDRLNATRENLDRVGLLIGEIAPRLTQLEAQARQAGEYARLTEQLGTALQALYGLQWSDREAALAAARRTYEERMNAVVLAQAEAERLAADLASIGADLAGERERAATGEQGVRELDDRLRRAGQRLALLAERHAMIEQRVSEIARDIDTLRREQAEFSADADGAPDALADAAEAAAELAAVEAELRDAQAEQDAALREQAAADDVLRQARAQSSAADDRASRLERELRGLEREQAEQAGRRNGLLARLRKHGADTLRLEGERLRAKREFEAAGSDQATARRQAAATRDARQAAERAHAEIMREREALEARYELLARLRDDARGGDEALRLLVDAAQRSGPDAPPRLLAVLADLLRVQRGCEAAIEAALGDQLAAVLVPEAADARAAVDVLLSEQSGRATIVALASLRPARPVNLSGERGVVGVASRLVKCDGRYRDVVDTLLGRVIVVEDGAAAERMLPRGLGTVVTLDGTLYRTSGAVSAGKAGAAGLVLAYQQELDELPGRIAALRTLEAAKAREAEETAEQERAAERLARTVEAQWQAAEHEHRAAEDGLVRARVSIAALKGEAGFLRGAGGGFAERRVRLRDDLTSANAERGRLLQQFRAAQHAAEQIRQRSDTLRGPVNTLRGRMASALGARQALEQQHVALQRLHDGRRAAAQRVEGAIASRGADLAQRRAELEALAGEQREAASEAARLRAELADARAALQPLRERVTVLARRERELGDAHLSGRRTLIDYERASMEAEAAVSRRAQAIERLREELEAEGLEPPLDNGAAAVAAAAALAARVLGGVANGSDTAPLDLGTEPEAGAPAAQATIERLQSRVRSLRAKVRQIGPVNAQAQADYDEARERHEFLSSQVADLRVAEQDVQEALDELRRMVRERFRESFHAVNADFGRYFKTFFGGGNARLALTEPEDYGESGVDILAQPPGKRQQHLQLLSGGERSLAAVALLFALLETNPAPFCVLDEVDAALDEANVGRFSETLATLAQQTQFVLITHNRSTVQAAGAIYGITMSGDGVSTVLSLRLDEHEPAGGQ